MPREINSLTLRSTGATELKGILSGIKELGVDVKYISAPKYKFTSEGVDYADAEKKISQAESLVKEKLKKGVFSLEKEKLKRAKEDIMEGI